MSCRFSIGHARNSSTSPSSPFTAASNSIHPFSAVAFLGSPAAELRRPRRPGMLDNGRDRHPAHVDFTAKEASHRPPRHSSFSDP